VFSGEATNINPTIYRTQGEHAIHYITDEVILGEESLDSYYELTIETPIPSTRMLSNCLEDNKCLKLTQERHMPYKLGP